MVIFQGSDSLNCFIQYFTLNEQPERWWKDNFRLTLVTKFTYNLSNTWLGNKCKSHVTRASWTVRQYSHTGLQAPKGASSISLVFCCWLEILNNLIFKSVFYNKGWWDHGTRAGAWESRITHYPHPPPPPPYHPATTSPHFLNESLAAGWTTGPVAVPPSTPSRSWNRSQGGVQAPVRIPVPKETWH